MLNLSENYHLRKCFLQRGQVPTQSVIKKKMSPPLADVYFKSMSSKLKVIAGLEPSLKGGGKSWYIPPKELLKGRVVMKPIKNKHLAKLNYGGLDDIGMTLCSIYQDRMKKECEHKLHKNDVDWQKKIIAIGKKEWVDRSAFEEGVNKLYLNRGYSQFATLYSSSLRRYQDIIFDAAINKIRSFREETFQKMASKYSRLVEQQATMLYDRYTEKLMQEKMRLRTNFIRDVETARTVLGDKLHDINLDKHVAVEKLRKFLECQKLACQVYVSLKEQQECAEELDLAKRQHKKSIQKMTEDILNKDVEIYLANVKEKRQMRFNRIWEKKVCHVVKNFQMFVSYCLKMLPEHADFFINMEKLMLLQLNEALNDPSTENIYVPEAEAFHTPVPRPNPFYLFCDKAFKAVPSQKLCPKHCTSSASQMPVIVINKRFIYAACDNFEQFTDKIKDYIDDNLDNHDLEDHHNYNHDVPVKYTISNQLLEVKLQSSLQQILQQEIENIKGVDIVCPGCKNSYCYCDYSASVSHTSLHSDVSNSKESSLPSIPSGNKISTRYHELQHEREPKWDSYLKFTEPKKCDCTKMAKKHLMENLPSYMRKMSRYEPPELLNYEPISVRDLKNLVKKARGRKEAVLPPPKLPSRTKDVAVQSSDLEYDFLCTCFSDDNLYTLLNELTSIGNQFRVVGGSTSGTYLTQESINFASDRVASLRRLINHAPEIKEIFKKKDCYFN